MPFRAPLSCSLASTGSTTVSLPVCLVTDSLHCPSELCYCGMDRGGGWRVLINWTNKRTNKIDITSVLFLLVAYSSLLLPYSARSTALPPPLIHVGIDFHTASRRQCTPSIPKFPIKTRIAYSKFLLHGEPTTSGAPIVGGDPAYFNRNVERGAQIDASETYITNHVRQRHVIWWRFDATESKPAGLKAVHVRDRIV